MLLDNFLPVYDFGEVHVIVVHAPPGRIFRAIKEFTPAEIPLLRTLLQIRSLPARLAGKGGVRLAGGHSLFGQFLNAGFVLLAEEMDRELVAGRIGQFWKMWGGLFPKIADTGEFLAFDRPGYARAAVNFYVHESSDDGCVTVSTETRIFVPDPITRKKFAAYLAHDLPWGCIHPKDVAQDNQTTGGTRLRATSPGTIHHWLAALYIYSQWISRSGWQLFKRGP